MLEAQVRGALGRLIDATPEAEIFLAYEPIWAIGENGIAASADYAPTRHAEIASVAQEIMGRRIPCLYGGSVEPHNCVDFISCPDIDGLLGGPHWMSKAISTSSRAALQLFERITMNIAIAGDTAGEGLAKVLAEHLEERFDVYEISRAANGLDAFYANLSDRVATGVAEGEYDRAILVCGTGIGVCISANKVPGIRAALTHDTYSAERAALSNNAQIITMCARVVGVELAKSIAEAYLAQTFDERGVPPAMSWQSTRSTPNIT